MLRNPELFVLGAVLCILTLVFIVLVGRLVFWRRAKGKVIELIPVRWGNYLARIEFTSGEKTIQIVSSVAKWKKLWSETVVVMYARNSPQRGDVVNLMVVMLVGLLLVVSSSYFLDMLRANLAAR